MVKKKIGDLTLQQIAGWANLGCEYCPLHKTALCDCFDKCVAIMFDTYYLYDTIELPETGKEK